MDIDEVLSSIREKFFFSPSPALARRGGGGVRRESPWKSSAKKRPEKGEADQSKLKATPGKSP
jgi:hypothetical protein